MSLATTSAGGLGGGAGGGGLSMAHSAHAMARPAPQQPPPQSSGIPVGPSTTAAPPSVAALGADLLDKSQSLTMKQVRNLSKYPIVAVDLYASDPVVAMFPPKPKDPMAVLQPRVVGKIKPHVLLKKSEAAQKTLRKYLTKSRGYTALLTDSLGPDGVSIERPHQWLGSRRVSESPEFVQESFSIVNDSSSHAIAEESTTSVGVTVANGTLDGTSAPSGDDFDRVVYKVRLCDSKKALAVLPEEAVTLVLAHAKTHVSRKVPKVNDEDEEEALEYPMAVPVPAWACNDASVEALLDATGGSGVIVQRSVAALAGALLPGEENHPNAILERVNQVRTAKHKEHRKEHPESADEFEYDALLVLVGVTAEGVECTAVQVSALQPSCTTCLFGNFNVLCNVSYLHRDPASQVSAIVREVCEKLEDIAPETDGPVAFVTYGASVEEQKKMKSIINLAKSNIDTWEKVPVFTTRSDCVAMGAAILGGVSHGRVRTVTTASGKPKPQLAIRVQNVAPTAVGVRMNYYGGVKDKWTPVKVIFDFDRRVPAGPYDIDLKATECAAMQSARAKLADEDLLKAAKEFEGSGGIPEREKAALEFRLQVVQQLEREGEWINVGDQMSPLTKEEGDDDERVACESVALQLSLASTGIITSGLVGDRVSVVQATVSARNSKLRYYIGILLAVLFFGGFLVKSYMEEKIFERDTERLLAYYKHVVPGSIMDGDLHNARYLVWKYRGKKEKLWKRLENKYGVPVLHAHEYEDEDDSKESNEDVENLDEHDASADDATEGESKSEEAPDL